MNITLQKASIENAKTQILIIGYWQDIPNPDVQKIDKQLRGTIQKATQQKTFTGEFLQTKTFSTLDMLPFDTLLLIGLGIHKEFDLEKLRKTTATAAITARDQHFTRAATNLHTLTFDASLADKTAAVVDAITLSLYHFNEYKTVDRDKIKTIDSFELLEQTHVQEVNEALTSAAIVTDATCFVRTMVNQPASYMTPIKIAEIAQSLPKQITVTIHDKKALQKMRMNAILAVNNGSAIEPRLIILEYHGSKDAPIALVGKGVTFDSGGLNIKPDDNMETMKMDMAGAAAVIGTFKAAAALRLPIHLLGVLPCTENMLGGNAYKPGDIITTYNGKTIEIINTDAEGRVILSDALAYTETFKPSMIIDLATLTGACIVALGHHIAGIIGTDKKLISALITAGEHSGEKLWELPLLEEFKEAIKSDIADVRNLSTIGRDAGAITGAAFLHAFITKTPWAHLDIAGPAWSTEDKTYTKKGGTGFGVRLLTTFLKSPPLA